MWRYHYALVWFMFVVNREDSYQIPHVLVEPKAPLCIEEGSSILLTYILHLNISSSNVTVSSSNWSAVWYQDGLQLTNTTIIHYANNSIASTFVAKSSGLFTCVVKDPPQSSNGSASIEMRPKPVAGLIATPKFITDEDGFRYVMVSWLRQSSEYEYSVFFKIDLHGCFSMPCVDDYIEATCNEMECTVLLDTDGNDLSDLSFYIVTRHGACETRSKVWNYDLTLSSCGVLPPKTLFCVPFPPTKLEIYTSYRRVILRWQDILLWNAPSVLLTYYCPKTSTNRTTKLDPPEIRIIRLLDKDIPGYAPYGKCTFCLSIQDYRCGQFSEPLCKTTRLNEEAPSDAPAITCTNDTCPTSYDDQFRNLTVTWELPAEKYWGGILREIRLRYLATSSNSAIEERLVINVTSNNATVGRLNKTLDYTIRLQACNRGGCSGYSDPLQVYGIRARPKYLTKTNSSGGFTIEWYLIGAGSIGFAFLVIVCMVGILRLYSEPRNQSLESITPPNTHDYSDVSDADSYHQLSRSDISPSSV